MRINDSMDARELDIAVVGLDCRVPGAKNAEEFWNNIKNGVEALSWLTDEELINAGVSEKTIQDPNYVKAAFKLDDVEHFDAQFFGFTPKEACYMDPQQRLMLEITWHALEDAGCNPDTFKGKIGVFAGASISQYLLKNIMPNVDIENPEILRTVWMENDLNYLTTMLSYKLNLKGPSVTVQTACSTSLSAIAMAVQSLQNYQCDMALAGGCKVLLPQNEGYLYMPGEILSPDGHCRPFDAKGQGTVSGSGVGMVVLKRLSDALEDSDQIIAVIKGSAINNDGNDKIGFTAPSINGERRAVREALLLSEIEADTITYMETHGTGTPLGDPIEIQALTEAWRKDTSKKNYCALGAVKANVGHLDTAAGVIGFIKACLVLKNKQLPPLVNYEQPNPNIAFEDSPFYVNQELKDWEPYCKVRRAAVSAFGIGGTNVHVILEEAIDERKISTNRQSHLLLLSGRTLQAMQENANQLADYLEKHEDVDFRNAFYTMNVERHPFSYRGCVAASDSQEAVDKLRNIAGSFCQRESNENDIVFLFPGQGTQYIGMARGLYESEPVFRDKVNECNDIVIKKTGINIVSLLYDSPESQEYQDILRDTKNTHIAIFIIEYAVASLLISMGIVPSAMAGHSIGEYVAACVGGLFDLETGLEIMIQRGRIISSLERGSMLSARMSEEEARKYCSEEVNLAVVNTEELVVFSGSKEGIEKLEAQISEQYSAKHLHTSHAFHSYMLNEGAKELRDVLSKVEFHDLKIPYVSNVTGDWIGEEAKDPEYWVKHMLGTVQFKKDLEVLNNKQYRYFFEVGSGNTLTTFVRTVMSEREDFCCIETIRRPNMKAVDEKFFLEQIGKAWRNGIYIKWKKFYETECFIKTSLPGYSFEKNRYWINAGRIRKSNEGAAIGEEVIETISTPVINVEQGNSRANLTTAYVEPDNVIETGLVEILEEIMGVNPIGVLDNFYELGGHSLMAAQISSRIRDTYSVELSINALMDNQTIRELASYIFDKLMEENDEN